MEYRLRSGWIIGFNTGELNMPKNLCEAVKNKDWIAVKSIIEQGGDINQPEDSHSERTALYYAVKNTKDLQILAFLLKHGADLHIGESSRDPWWRWIKVVQVDLLVKHGFNVNIQDSAGFTPLHYAAMDGKTKLLTELLRLKADWKIRNIFGETPLHRCTTAGCVQALLEHGADINCVITGTKNFEKTCLHTSQSREVTEALVKHGLNVNVKDSSGKTRLHYADNLDILKFLVEAGADVNSRDNFGKTPLHYVDNLDILKFLVEAGADVNSQDQQGDTPLHIILKRHIESHCPETPEFLFFLFWHGGDIALKNRTGKTPFDLASESGLLQEIRNAYKEWTDFLLALGNNPYAKEEPLPESYNADLYTRTSPFHYVNTVEHARFLFDAGVQVNIQDDSGWTLLHQATFLGNTELVKFLLTSGANCNLRCKGGGTPLWYVNTVEYARLLLSSGADINAENYKGETLLHKAVSSRNTELVEFLLESGADCSIEDDEGKTPFHFVLTIEDARLLLKAGANINAQDDEDKTLLHQAASSCNVELIKFLLESGADCNIKDDDRGRTALYYAADAEIMKALVKAGGDISIVDQNGVSLLEYFMRENVNWEIVKFLLESGIEVPDYFRWDSSEPIEIACSQDQLDIVKLLYERGAVYGYSSDPCHIICPETEYTGHAPADKKRWDLFFYLMETKKGHFRFDSCYGCAHSPLVAAARQGEWDMIKNALLKCSEWVKGIINEWAEDGGTLLLLAADSKNTEMIQLLIEHGANPNADNQGFFLLSKAQHDSDFLIFLLEHGVDANASCGDDSILAEWVYDGDVEGVRILKKYGARITPELLEIEYIDDEMEQLLRGFLAEGE